MKKRFPESFPNRSRFNYNYTLWIDIFLRGQITLSTCDTCHLYFISIYSIVKSVRKHPKTIGTIHTPDSKTRFMWIFNVFNDQRSKNETKN